jgi:parvulin-like peptidyl-prolyl isomerase
MPSRPASRATLLASIPLFVACARVDDPVVLRLSGQDVRLSAFEAELETLRQAGVAISTPELRVSAFQRFVEDQALAIEALRLGLVVGRDRRSMEEFLLARVGSVEVSEADARAYFETRPELAVTEPRVQLREILVTTQQDARDVARILSRDPNSFELLARTRSRSPHAENGGRMGSFQPGELPAEIERAVQNLREGSISEIVATSFGFHVLRVDNRKPSGPRAFEDARPEIEARLRETRTRLKVRTLIADILSRTQVNPDAIRIRR